MNAALKNDFLAPALSKQRVQPAGHMWNVYNASVTPDINTPEKLCDPALWRLCDHLKPLDRIEAVDDNMTFFAMLIVVAVNPGAGVVVRPIHWWPIEGVQPIGAPLKNKTGAGVFYRGPVRKWCVERTETNGETRTLRDSFETAAEAGSWLAQLNEKQAST